MKLLLPLLPWIGVMLSLLSFFWIGFRREKAEIQKRLDAAKSALDKVKIAFWFFLPYGIGALGVVGLSYALLKPPFIVIGDSDHILYEVKGCGDDPVKLPQPDSGTGVPIRCSEDHFSFTVKGRILRPALEQLRERFGSKDVLVYVVVSEEQNDGTKGQCWPQMREAKKLDSLGMYTSKGFFAGDGTKGRKAEEGELFSIQILIPDRDVELGPHPFYWCNQPPKYPDFSAP
jgi:hypothetical protein